MRISAIQNRNFVNSRNNTKKNTQSPNFKGYTYIPEMKSVTHVRSTEYYYDYPPSIVETGYKIEEKKCETPYRRDTNIRNSPGKVYVASPGEDVPGEIYKDHTHIQRNDMYLSQIRNDYFKGYMNFANNAYGEMQHLEWMKETAPEGDKEKIEGKLSRAQKRFDVLMKMDKLSGRREELREYKPDTETEKFLLEVEKKEKLFQKISKDNVNKIERNKREKILNELKEKLKIRQEEFEKSEQKRLSEISSIEEQMRREFSNIEKFYKEYYPEWTD